MKLKKELNVSADEYFDFLEKNLVADFKKKIDKKFTKKDLVQGYKFKKVYKSKGQEFVSNQELVEYERPLAYCLKMEMMKDTRYISHHIKVINDNKIELTYEENLKTRSLYHKMMHASNKANSKKVMSKMIQRIEEDIISKRK